LHGGEDMGHKFITVPRIPIFTTG